MTTAASGGLGPVFSTKIPSVETPVSQRPTYVEFIPSAMKGVVLTSTGESLAASSQAERELVSLFNSSPKLEVGLNFAKIFDFEAGDHIYTQFLWIVDSNGDVRN